MARYRYHRRRSGNTWIVVAVAAVAMASLGAHAATGSRAPTAASRQAIAFAKAQIGKPYLWGGTGPGAFDCSGLVMEAYAAAGREIFPAYGEAVDRLVARIHENGGGESAPRPGDPMPPFILPDETGRLVNLKSKISSVSQRNQKSVGMCS